MIEPLSNDLSPVTLDQSHDPLSPQPGENGWRSSPATENVNWHQQDTEFYPLIQSASMTQISESKKFSAHDEITDPHRIASETDLSPAPQPAVTLPRAATCPDPWSDFLRPKRNQPASPNIDKQFIHAPLHFLTNGKIPRSTCP
ncbi:hypothetical protein Hypma_004561 [Hypsizygus marmoreus]|uniref:Uncharacterized protein n=1 Tax=Hypsizygus marmoreus TaxID=39966 RepID=A0A369J4Q7_HYPMA|nr:hypothetical protein Hypma_004561 [Hypsizygus marmoreus]